MIWCGDVDMDWEGKRKLLKCVKKRKANWSEHMLKRYYLIGSVTEGEVKGRRQTTVADDVRNTESSEVEALVQILQVLELIG